MFGEKTLFSIAGAELVLSLATVCAAYAEQPSLSQDDVTGKQKYSSQYEKSRPSSTRVKSHALYSFTEKLYKQYLDEMWLRTNRAWGILPERKSGSFAVSFKVDRSGRASEISITKPSGSVVLDRRAVSTIKAASPFPDLPAGAPKQILVRCQFELNDGMLAIDLRMPDLESDRFPCPVAKVGDSDKLSLLMESLRTGDKETRQEAIVELRTLGSNAAAAVPLLVDCVQGKDQDLRSYAFTTLESLGPSSKAAVPAMIKVLNGVGDDRRFAANVLASIGPDAQDAVPALLQATDDQGVQEYAASALRSIGPEAARAAIPHLIAYLKQYLTSVPDILAKFGPMAIPAVVEKLKDGDANTWCNAMETFKRMGKEALPALPVIIEGLAMGGQTGEKAAEALANLGPSAESAVPGLLIAMKNKDESMRRNAVIALGAIGPAARDALPVLRNALQDDYLKDDANDSIKRIEATEQ